MLHHSPRSIPLVTFLFCSIAPLGISAQQSLTDSSLLTVDRIFGSSEFDGDEFGNPRWLDDSTYTLLEPAKPPATGRDIVRYDAASGRRSILFPSTSLVPAGATKPLAVESFRISPDGKLVLIYTNSRKVWRQNTRGDYWVLDRGTGRLRQLGAKMPASSLMFAKFSPDSRRVYVSIWNQARTVAAVGVLDTATNQFLATIPVRTRPYLSAVTPDGQRLYVPNHDSGTISVIDTGTNTVTSEIKVAPNPHWVEMSADGSRAYAANHESNVVSVIDTSDNSILAEVPVQTSPHSLAVHPNRPLVANVNYDSASVTMIDTNTDRVVATVAVGKNPQDISWAPDGRHAYVANTSDGTVSVIDAETETVTATIRTGTSPTSVAVLPDGSAAYVSNLGDGTLSVLNIAG